MEKKLIVSIIFLSILLQHSCFCLEGEFNNASLLDIIKIIAKQQGLNLIIAGNQEFLERKTTLLVNDLKGEALLESLLKSNGIQYNKEGKNLTVSALPEDTQQTAYPKISRSFDLKYISAERACKLVKDMFPEIAVIQDSNNNQILAKGKTQKLEEIEKIIKMIDKPFPQIMIESKIVEISKTDSHRLGFSYGNQNGFCFLVEDTSLKPIDDLILKIETLISAGKAKIVAQPKIATTPYNEANINIGHRIPYALPVESKTNTTWTVNYIDAGIKLKILPQIIDDKTILASIQSEISNISEWKTTQAGDFPVISGRSAQTEVKVESGNTIVIGGLVSNQDIKNVIKFPILGYLPIIGIFFQSEVMEKRETEIVFLIKPYVI